VSNASVVAADPFDTSYVYAPVSSNHRYYSYKLDGENESSSSGADCRYYNQTETTTVGAPTTSTVNGGFEDNYSDIGDTASDEQTKTNHQKFLSELESCLATTTTTTTTTTPTTIPTLRPPPPSNKSSSAKKHYSTCSPPPPPPPSTTTTNNQRVVEDVSNAAVRSKTLAQPSISVPGDFAYESHPSQQQRSLYSNGEDLHQSLSQLDISQKENVTDTNRYNLYNNCDSVEKCEKVPFRSDLMTLIKRNNRNVYGNLENVYNNGGGDVTYDTSRAYSEVANSNRDRYSSLYEFQNGNNSIYNDCRTYDNTPNFYDTVADDDIYRYQDSSGMANIYDAVADEYNFYNNVGDHVDHTAAKNTRVISNSVSVCKSLCL
jgi:hypothetical protein